MPVEKLRETDDFSVSTIGQQRGVNNKEHNKENNNGAISTSPPSKNGIGILHKSGSKLGFNKKKNGEVNGHSLSSSNGKRIGDDPFRFSGDGVDFKAKLIGVREVGDARGDQMCQDAMQLCKAIVKSSGQHKQRIFFNISLEGLKIKEQSNGQVVHSFPVSKVSFIAKDVTDNRAFGFIYGSPEEKHKFYAIKTEKTSDQVVISIRDMFHVVYEMKKKQMEDAKHPNKDSINEQASNGPKMESLNSNGGTPTVTKDENGVEVADLLDLETELQNLKQGVQDMNTAWDDFNPREGETQPTGPVLSSSLSAANFGGHGFQYQQQQSYHGGGQFYQGDHRGGGGIVSSSTPDFHSLTTSASLNDTMSSMSNGGSSDPFGTDAFNPAAAASVAVGGGNASTSFLNGQQNSPPIGGVLAAVLPPPVAASRRRTTSSTSSNPTAPILFETPANGQYHPFSNAPPSLLIDKQISLGTSSIGANGELHGLGSSPFDSPQIASADPFDTSHATRLVNSNHHAHHHHHHAASTPIPRFLSTTASPQQPHPHASHGGSISLEMSQAPSAILGSRSSAVSGDFSSPQQHNNSVFGTPANQDVFASPVNGSQDSRSVSISALNQGFYGSQFGASQQDTTDASIFKEINGQGDKFDNNAIDNSSFATTTSTAIWDTPLTTKKNPASPLINSESSSPNPNGGASLTAFLIGNNTPQMSSSPQQSLLNANILKAPNATSVDQAFNVLCNLDSLIPPQQQQQQQQQYQLQQQQQLQHQFNLHSINNGVHGGSVPKEDLFAQLRPPPKKSINELRGSPPTSNAAGSIPTSLSALDELYSSSPNSIKTASSIVSAPPIPPRVSCGVSIAAVGAAAANGGGIGGGLLPPPSSALPSSESRRPRPLPQPINGTTPNGISVGGGGGFFANKSDPFADDPFFA